MTVVALTVTLAPLGQRHQATVLLAGETLSTCVRDDARTAAILAVEAAAHDVAHELVRSHTSLGCPRCGHPAGSHSNAREDDYQCAEAGCGCPGWLPSERGSS